MKKFFLIVLFFIGIFVFYKVGGFQTSNIKAPNSFNAAKKITVQQKITSEKSADTFEKYEIEENKTALDLLNQTGTIITKGEKENAFVIEINGRRADDSKKEYWSFYLNGKISAVGAGSYLLKNEDKIEWKIEKY